MRLEQHLRNADAAAEVAVNLEGRMRAKEVRKPSCAAAVIGGAVVGGTQDMARQLVRAVALAEARPEVDPPAQRPAGALIAAGLEGPPIAVRR